MALYKNQNFYAITISPPPRPGCDIDLYKSDKYLLCKLIKRCSKHFSLWPEFSPYNDRLHYHGIIRIDDFIKWYRYSKPMIKRLGFIKIDKIKTFKDHLKFIIYSTKEYNLKGLRRDFVRLTPGSKKAKVLRVKNKNNKRSLLSGNSGYPAGRK